MKERASRKRIWLRTLTAIAADFAAVPVTYTPKVKVGVVGEIYVKYSPLGNNNLEQFLHGEDCEVNLPGLLGFVHVLCCQHGRGPCSLYGGSQAVGARLRYVDELALPSGKS